MKSLLFTGASGFLGKNILPILKENYSVDTLSYEPCATYVIDLVRDTFNLRHSYEVVLHAAGKAHVVPQTENEVQSFFDVNYQGSINLCNVLEKTGLPESFVFISTVAVYGCEEGELITEDYPLQGESPYAKSKILAEKYLSEWCFKHNIKLTILRPSLLAGINPPGNLGAMIKGISSGKYLSVAGGRARKSMAMASDIAKIVPLCEKKSGIFNLCDSNNPSFYEIELLISSQLNKKKPLNVPYFLAFFLAYLGNRIGKNAPINSDKLKKIVQTLTFSNQNIINELKFSPADILANFRI